MKRRAVVIVLLILGFIVVFYCAGRVMSPSVTINDYNYSNTNLVFISIDTLRADHLGVYGYRRNTSPNIDKFADQKILFTNFFTVVPKTGPSMVSFFTGKRINSHGVVSNMSKIKKDENVLADFLPSDYMKAAFVNNIVLSKKAGYDTGFDTYNLFDQIRPDLFTNHVISWLKKNHEKQFFLWIHYLDPHGPYLPPDECKKMFVNDRYYDGSKKIKIGSEKDLNAIGLGHVPFYQVLNNHDEVDYYISQYDAEIFNIDKQIGRLLKLFERKGLFENTIIIFTADHGESLGEDNYFFEHGLLLNEGSIHIPFIMSHPAIAEPMVIDALADNTDFLPTILSLLGLKYPDGIDGIDVKGLLVDDHMSTKPYIISQTPMEYFSYEKMVRGKEYKFILTGDCIKVDNKTSKTVGIKSYSYFRISNGIQDSVNMVDQLDQKEKERFIGVIHQITDSKDTTIANDTVNLSEDTLKALKSLGYVN